MEESLAHNAAIAYEFGSKEFYVKQHMLEEWLEYIDKVIAEDEDFAPKGMSWYDDDVVEAARKSSSGLDYRQFRSRTDLYIRGFQDGQYWRQQNPKTE